MKILLDTHAWLWMMLEPRRIGEKTRGLIGDPDNSFVLSLASVWELAIKHAAGRLVLPEEPLGYVQSRTRADGVAILPLQLEHVCAAAQLPRHHADLFDRLLIAQAHMEGAVLMTHDQHIPRYAIETLDPAR